MAFNNDQEFSDYVNSEFAKLYGTNYNPNGSSWEDQMRRAVLTDALAQKNLSDPNSMYWKNKFKNVDLGNETWNDAVKRHLASYNADSFWGKGGQYDKYGNQYGSQWASVGRNYDPSLSGKYQSERDRIYQMMGITPPQQNTQAPQPTTPKPQAPPIQAPVNNTSNMSNLLDPAMQRFGPALNGQYTQTQNTFRPQAQTQPQPFQNNYLNAMNNMATGNYGMTGQAMGQPMAQPQPQQQGTWSQFHNVMQKPGALARRF